MEIHIRTKGFTATPTQRDHAKRRIHAHLSRFGREIAQVTLRLTDVNGPKGGLDKVCQIVVKGPKLGVATLAEQTGEVLAAIDLAVERIAAAIGRTLERQRDAATARVSLRRAS